MLVPNRRPVTPAVLHPVSRTSNVAPLFASSRGCAARCGRHDENASKATATA